MHRIFILKIKLKINKYIYLIYQLNKNIYKN